MMSEFFNILIRFIYQIIAFQLILVYVIRCKKTEFYLKCANVNKANLNGFDNKY